MLCVCVWFFFVGVTCKCAFATRERSKKSKNEIKTKKIQFSVPTRTDNVAPHGKCEHTKKKMETIFIFYYFYGLRSLPSFTTTYSLFSLTLLSNVCLVFLFRSGFGRFLCLCVCVCVVSLRPLCLPSSLFSPFCDCCTSLTVLVVPWFFFLFHFKSAKHFDFFTTYFSISITLTPTRHHWTTNERTHTLTSHRNEMTKNKRRIIFVFVLSSTI